MSEMERAAAEHARLQSERARQGVEKEVAAQEQESRSRRRGREEAQEFYALATRHGAPFFRRYVTVDREYGLDYHRTDDLCVVAVEWTERMRRFGFDGWAVAADGAVFGRVSLHVATRGRRESHAFSSRDGERGRPFPAAGSYTARFVAAVSALTAPVPMVNGHRTGLQPDGAIGYWL